MLFTSFSAEPAQEFCCVLWGIPAFAWSSRVCAAGADKLCFKIFSRSICHAFPKRTAAAAPLFSALRRPAVALILSVHLCTLVWCSPDYHHYPLEQSDRYCCAGGVPAICRSIACGQRRSTRCPVTNQAKACRYAPMCALGMHSRLFFCSMVCSFLLSHHRSIYPTFLITGIG